MKLSPIDQCSSWSRWWADVHHTAGCLIFPLHFIWPETVHTPKRPFNLIPSEGDSEKRSRENGYETFIHCNSNYELLHRNTDNYENILVELFFIALSLVPIKYIRFFFFYHVVLWTLYVSYCGERDNQKNLKANQCDWILTQIVSFWRKEMTWANQMTLS